MGLNGLDKTAYDMAQAIFGSGTLNKYVKLLSPDVWLGSGSTALSIITAIYNLILPLGAYIVLYYFLAEIITKVSMEQMTVDTLLKSFIKLFIAIMLIRNGLTIFKVIAAVGDVIISGVTGQLAGSGTTSLGLPDRSDLKHLNLLDGLGFVIVSGIFYIISVISTLGVAVASISVGLKIWINMMFSPIALADSFNGMSSNSVRYLRGFLALVLQGSIIAVLIGIRESAWDIWNETVLGGNFSLENITSLKQIPPGYFIAATVVNVVVLAFSFKSEQISQKICGA